MHLDFFDHQVVHGTSALHRASAASKLLVVALTVAAMATRSQPSFYAALALVLLALVVTARLPVKAVAALALYPALFAALFAFGGLVPQGLSPWVVVARAATTAVAVLVLFATTPHGEIFTFFRLFLPGAVVDILFLTYRAFFILVQELQRTLLSLKLKGAGNPLTLARNLRAVAAALGLTVLHALELAERMHQVLALRGYAGRITTRRPWYQLTAADAVPLAFALIIAGMVVWL